MLTEEDHVRTGPTRSTLPAAGFSAAAIALVGAVICTRALIIVALDTLSDGH
jgi:hypothetical protein